MATKISDKAKRGLEWLGVRVTGSRWAWTVAISSIALWASTTHAPARGGAPTPNPARPPVELQSSTMDARTMALAYVTFGKLPDVIPEQHQPPCDSAMERAINGGCWIPLDLKPCPNGKAWIHEDDKKCYTRSMRFPRTPSAGEPAPSGVASPVE